MKVRNDFVTNSSSSSFIIGHKEDTHVTKDYVYNLVRGYYKEMLKQRDKLIKDIKYGKVKGVKYIKGEHYSEFEVDGIDYMDDNYWKVARKMGKLLEEKYNLDSYDHYKADHEYFWLGLNTYEEYENYWLDLMKEDSNKYAPFTIVDYANQEEVRWLHFGNGTTVEAVDTSVNNDELGWYFYRMSSAEYDFDCEKCGSFEWCDKEECAESKKVYNKHKNSENICLDILGRVCVRSESGYLPYSVVNKLMKVSNYGCNHMG